MASSLRTKFGDNTILRAQARDEAYKRMWIDIYRSKMRYDPERYADELDLDAHDIKNIQWHYKIDEQSQLPIKYVTISPPNGTDIKEIEALLMSRIFTKCYVGHWVYVIENGDARHPHPHIHLHFVSKVHWLAKSRIINEWSKVFDLPPGSIHVEPTNTDALPRINNYFGKEPGSVVVRMAEGEGSEVSRQKSFSKKTKLNFIN